MTLYSHDYDTTYPHGPALPVVAITVQAISTSSDGVGLTILVDSGADATILPKRILQRSGADVVGRAQMRWGTHHSASYDVYLVKIVIGSHVIRGVRTLADPTNQEAVLGRDVLNQLIVTLNGLAGVVEISE